MKHIYVCIFIHIYINFIWFVKYFSRVVVYWVALVIFINIFACYCVPSTALSTLHKLAPLILLTVVCDKCSYYSLYKCVCWSREVKSLAKSYKTSKWWRQVVWHQIVIFIISSKTWKILYVRLTVCNYFLKCCPQLFVIFAGI